MEAIWMNESVRGTDLWLRNCYIVIYCTYIRMNTMGMS